MNNNLRIDAFPINLRYLKMLSIHLCSDCSKPSYEEPAKEGHEKEQCDIAPAAGSQAIDCVRVVHNHHTIKWDLTFSAERGRTRS